MRFAGGIIPQRGRICKTFPQKISPPPGAGAPGAKIRVFSRPGRGMLDDRGDAV